MSTDAAVRSTVWVSAVVATGPPPKNWLPPLGAELGNPKPKNPRKSERDSGNPNAVGSGNRRGKPYSITVGVPSRVQPGTVTALYPDSDGSPDSASPLTSRLPLAWTL